MVKNSGDQKFEVNLGIGVTNTVNLATGHQLTDDGDVNVMFIMPQGFASNDGSPTIEDEESNW